MRSATSPRRWRATGAAPETRTAVVQRDRWQCVRCGKDVTSHPANIQHRKPRGMGGTRDASVNKAANLILLCGTGTTGCHGWVETHREAAHEAGWSIPWWASPEKVPVTYPDGRMYTLTNDGGKKAVDA